MKTLAISLLLILSLSAIMIGLGLIADPSGRSFMVPLELLEGTPFNNYFIPGILLLLLHGLPAFIIALLAVKKSRYYTLAIAMQGALLLLWLTAELALNLNFYYPLIHIPSFLIAILLIYSGLKLYYYKKQQTWVKEES